MRTLLLLASYLAATFGHCPDGNWTLLHDGRRCIRAYSALVSYSVAQRNCENDYGSLGSIQDATDTQLYKVATSLVTVSTGKVWIGLYKPSMSNIYGWDSGARLGYTNWKTDVTPVYATADCVTFETSTGNWISGNLCTKANAYVCETAAIDYCIREELQINNKTVPTMESEGARNNETISAHSCTRNVYIGKNVTGGAHIYVKAKVYTGKNTFLSFVDAVTGQEIKRYASRGERWYDIAFSTSTDQLTIEAFADRNGNLGYQIYFYAQPWNCNFETLNINTTTLSLTSPLYNSVLSSYYCAKQYTVPLGAYITISLTAYAGNESRIVFTEPETNRVVARLENSEEWRSTSFQTVGEKVYVEALSTHHGHLAFTWTLRKACSCGATSLTAQDNLYKSWSSPLYPNNYCDSLYCRYTIAAQPGHFIVFNVLDFETENSFDYIQFYNGPSTTSPQLMKLTGTNVSREFESSTNEVTALFNTDGSVSRRGFQINYKSICRCGDASLSATSSAWKTWTSPGYPSNYCNNMNCTYKITAPAGHVVIFNVTELNTESSFDYLRIFNGPSSSNAELKRLTGTTLVRFESTVNQLLAIFFTDGSVNLAGYRILYKSELRS